MPSPESQRGKQPESESPLYYRAARFRGPAVAGQVYDKAQRAIFKDKENDLSAYRFYVGPTWYVAVLGAPPPVKLQERIEEILSRGQLVSLSSETLDFLRKRRAEAIKHGSWVERHYRP